MDTAAIYANFAHSLSYAKPPGNVVEITKKLILDELGVMVHRLLTKCAAEAIIITNALIGTDAW